MKCAELNIAGFVFRVSSAHEKFDKIIHWLQDDFISCTGLSTKLISEIEIREFKKPFSIPFFWRNGLWAFKAKDSTYYSYNFAKVRMQIFFEGKSVPNKGKRVTYIDGENIHSIYNTIYLSIISHLVETFENSGWVPLHAFSAAYKNKNFALVAPSGFGKSLLAISLSRDSEFKVYGDELLFIKDSQAIPIPLRLALAPSILQALNINFSDLRPIYQNDQIHKMTMPNNSPLTTLEHLDNLFFISKKIPWVKNISPKISLAALWPLLSASGVPQMIQYLLRFDFLSQLPLKIWRRFEAIKIIEREGRYFEVEGTANDVVGLKKLLDECNLRAKRSV